MPLMHKFFRQKQYVAVKIVKSGETYTETALDEIKILKSVSAQNWLANFLVVIVELIWARYTKLIPQMIIMINWYTYWMTSKSQE